jgi:hypothetical protein
LVNFSYIWTSNWRIFQLLAHLRGAIEMCWNQPIQMQVKEHTEKMNVSHYKSHKSLNFGNHSLLDIDKMKIIRIMTAQK